jgi:hypothetical protein
MARRSGPTLYEAMSKSAPARPTASAPIGRRPGGDPDRPVPPALLTPGSMVRLPVGYVWVIGVLVAGMVIGAYLMGRANGLETGRSEMSEVQAATERVARETARLREPGTAAGVSGVPAPAPATGTRRDPAGDVPIMSTAPGGLVVPGGVAADPSGRPSDPLLDRRASGKSYYQIITTTFDDAMLTARLVSVEGASLGLDAQVVRGDTDRLASVILHPGFDLGKFTKADEDRWRRVIRELGSRVRGRLKLKSSSEQPFSDSFIITRP